MYEDLQLAFFQYCVAQRRMNDALFQIFDEKCPKIKCQTQLSLNSCDITNATMEAIRDKFTNLKILDISYSARLTQTGFNCLRGIKMLYSMQYLNPYFLLTDLTSLTELNLEHTPITDDSLRALSGQTFTASIRFNNL